MHNGYGYNHGASRYGSSSNIRGDVRAAGATPDSLGYGDYRNPNYNRVYDQTARASTTELIEAHMNGDMTRSMRPLNRPMSASASMSSQRYRSGANTRELPVAVAPTTGRVQSEKEVAWVQQAMGDRYTGQLEAAAVQF
jgi:hypothetical protein